MSVNTAGGSLTRRPGELARAGVNDIFAGLVASVITIAYGLSFAALIFAPPLNTWLAYGIAATFITSAPCPGRSSQRGARCPSPSPGPTRPLSRSPQHWSARWWRG
jgi:hypothetical protein